MQLKSEELHEKVARILGRGLVIERDRMHGGGFMVLGLDMQRCAGPFECEDLAHIALIRIQTDAILDLIFADRTELLATVERMRGHWRKSRLAYLKGEPCIVSAKCVASPALLSLPEKGK